jgi:hypothetical protein
VYAVGEPITGCVQLLGPQNELVDDEAVELILYRVTAIGVDSDTIKFLDVQLLRYDAIRAGYSFSIRTDIPLNPGTNYQHIWSPGYYDLRFNYPDNSVGWIRIQLVDPPPETGG